MSKLDNFNHKELERKYKKLLDDMYKGQDEEIKKANFKTIFGVDAESEKDPNGLDQHQAGAKLDAGKPRCGLVLGDFHSALLEVSKVGTYGADKYTESGWKNVPNGFSRYTDAMIRHWLKESGGEHYDRESGLLHAAQVAWNALARLQLLLNAMGKLTPSNTSKTGGVCRQS